jgi:hypothetical protein
MHEVVKRGFRSDRWKSILLHALFRAKSAFPCYLLANVLRDPPAKQPFWLLRQSTFQFRILFRHWQVMNMQKLTLTISMQTPGLRLGWA